MRRRGYNAGGVQELLALTGVSKGSFSWMKKKQPSATPVGFAYMLQGDMPIRNC